MNEPVVERIGPGASMALGTIVGIGPGTGAPPVGPAPGERHLWVEVAGMPRRALLAVPAPYQPSVGDRVVVFGEGEALCAVGVVEQRRQPRIALRGGGSAEVDDEGVIEIHDAEGRLKLRYDGEHLRLGVEAGDLVLEAAEGGVTIRGRDDVRIDAGRDLEQRASGALRQEATRIDLIAEQLFERTRDSVREVSSLLLTRAGRLRAVVRESLSLSSRRTSIKSEKDTEIDGERVLLG